jgi:V/A-type H+-transporting ATPase subunit E
MSIENILQRIEEETEASVREIMGKAEAQAAGIRDEYSKKGARLREELERKTRLRAADDERRLIVGEELELRKAVLERKREILSDIYREAHTRISKLPQAEYLELIKTFIVKNALSGREEIVPPAEQRGMFTAEYLESLNKARGGSSSFSLAEASGDFSWGVVLREGHRREDLTLGVVFEQVKERIESEIASLLFPE